MRARIGAQRQTQTELADIGEDGKRREGSIFKAAGGWRDTRKKQGGELKGKTLQAESIDDVSEAFLKRGHAWAISGRTAMCWPLDEMKREVNTSRKRNVGI